ncbi:MAG: hypothetical protein UZ17_ACD001001586 [Acidobacteria bacterium OLB17]|nr:MAG: hypothetical protein UZ17_ACD001001586 [Acidobacteria bacterium OLB17]MCZ2391388.1 hypothetical protein [Acidobacteriota bacterium]
MKSSKLLIILFLLLLPAFLRAQAADGVPSSDLWRARAESFTAKAIDTSDQLDSLGKALVYAKAGDIWWPLDRDRADQLYERSVDTIFFLSSDEVKADKLRFFDVTGKILALIAGRNLRQSKRLVSILQKTDTRDVAENGSKAAILVAFARAIVEDNPALAAEIGIAAMQVGQPPEIFDLYWRICRKDRTLASKLFDAILRSATANPNISIANTIKLAAFPELTIPNSPSAISSTVEQRTRALEFLLSYLVAQRNKFDTKQIESCENEASLIAPLLPQFAAIIPAQQGTAAGAVAHCQDAGSGTSRLDSQVDNPGQVTVEMLLRLADQEKDDSDKRGYYLIRAASLANDQEKYEQATKILEGMTQAEIQPSRMFWEILRYTVASRLAYKLLDQSDFAGALAVLDKVPEAIRPLARIGLGMVCSSDMITVQQVCADQMELGARDLYKPSKHLESALMLGMEAVQKLGKFGRPTEAIKLFDLIVRFTNSVNSDRKEYPVQITRETFDSAIDASFLSRYDQSILSSIGNLDDTESRINGYLSLANTSIASVVAIVKHSREQGAESQVH